MLHNKIIEEFENSVSRFSTVGVCVVGTVTLGATIEYSIVGGSVVMAVSSAAGHFVYGWVVKYYYHRLLEKFNIIKEPLFVIQEDENDRTVFLRAERVRNFLIESGNPLYKGKNDDKNKIEVVEIYKKDVTIDYCATSDEYAQRIEDFKINYLRAWAKRIGKISETWTKQVLYNQHMDTPTEDTFMARQFPIVSSLLKSKEVAE